MMKANNNGSVSSLINGVLGTCMHSSSLEEKADRYFSEDSHKSSFQENLIGFQRLLKEGDGLVHAMYKSCYSDTDDAYLKLYNSTPFQVVQGYISGDGKNLKDLFRKDPDTSGIFDYKVAYVAQEAFQGVELSGACRSTDDE